MCVYLKSQAGSQGIFVQTVNYLNVAPRYIQNDSELLDLLDEIATSNWVALDTEFIRVKTYRPQLALIQLATDQLIALIDPIPMTRLQSLWDFLDQPSRVKILHAAHQDLEIIFLAQGHAPSPIFDTQVAADLLKMGVQIGYQSLVEQCTSIVLEKDQSRTDWMQRPLSAAQCLYAADDVRYLGAIYHLLRAKLLEQDCVAEMEKQCHALTQSTRFTTDPWLMWKKVKGVQYLRGVELAVLRHLAAWRELRAVESDKPRRWIISDEVLLQLAKIQPTTPEDLRKINMLEAKTIQRYGTHFLDLIELACAEPKENWPKISKRRR